MKKFPLCFFLFVFLSGTVSAQLIKGFVPQVIAEASAAAHGHGIYSSIGAGHRIHTNIFIVSALVQTESRKLNGLKCSWYKLITGSRTRGYEGTLVNSFELTLGASLQYIGHAQFSAYVVDLETRCSYIEKRMLESMRVNTLQGLVGFGGNFPFEDHLFIHTDLMFGVYCHSGLNAPLYHERVAPILGVSAGIFFSR